MGFPVEHKNGKGITVLYDDENLTVIKRLGVIYDGYFYHLKFRSSLATKEVILFDNELKLLKEVLKKID